MYHFIKPSERGNIHKYKYAAIDKSLISRYVLGPYWNWLVTLFPLSVAPNTITLLGLLLIVANVASLLFLDPALQNSTEIRATIFSHVTKPQLPVVPLAPRDDFPHILFASTRVSDASVIPGWLLIVWSISLFMYQSFDSIDGKQARRTGMAGPLGEMFDHGCDALNTVLEVLLAVAALGLGRSILVIMLLTATTVNFYLTTWEEFHTHTLFLSAFSGPVEGILLTCTIYTASALLGGPVACNQGVLNATNLYKNAWVVENLAWANYPVNDILIVCATAGIVFNIVTSYGNVTKSCMQKNASPIRPLMGLLPITVQVLANVIWVMGNDGLIFADGPAFVAFIVYWGISFAYMVGLLIVAHVCHAPFPHWNITCLLSILGAIDANLSTYVRCVTATDRSPLVQTSAAATNTLVFAMLAFVIALHSYFIYDVITSITTESTSPALRSR